MSALVMPAPATSEVPVTAFTVTSKFWSGETGRRLTDLVSNNTRAGERLNAIAARYLAAYLMTSPVANKLGLYNLPFPQIIRDTGLRAAEILIGFRILAEDGFAEYDEATQTVWVVEMARQQVGRGYPVAADNERLIGAIKELFGKLPRCPQLPKFIEKYAQSLRLPMVPLDRFETPVNTGSVVRLPARRRLQTETSDELPDSDPNSSRPAIATPSGKVWGNLRDLELARYMFGKVRIVVPTAAEPSLVQWANEIRQMRLINGRDHNEIRLLFDFANADSFWGINILSPKKLRDKWEMLIAHHARKHGAEARPVQRFRNEV